MAGGTSCGKYNRSRTSRSSGGACDSIHCTYALRRGQAIVGATRRARAGIGPLQRRWSIATRLDCQHTPHGWVLVC